MGTTSGVSKLFHLGLKSNGIRRYKNVIKHHKNYKEQLKKHVRTSIIFSMSG